MMAKNKRTNRTKKTKTSLTRRFFAFLLSRPVRWLLLLAIFLALLFSLVGAFNIAAGEVLIDTFGVGLILVVLAMVFVGWMVWRRRIPGFLRRWNRWLGAIAFSLALFGLLAFFKPQGVLLSDATWGGNLGRVILGAPDALGALRLVGIVLVGIFLVAPRTSWRFVSTSTSALANLYRRYPLHKYLWGTAPRLWVFYQRYPLHRILTSRFQRPPKPTVEPVERVEYETPGVVEPEADRSAQIAETPPLVAQEKVERVKKSGIWQLPSLNILVRTPEIEPAQVDTERGSRLIEEALASYGVEAKVVQVNVGPTVTQYGVEPGWDRKFKEIKEKDKDGNIRVRLEEVSKTRVKVERIASLANDLALALAATAIKIEAPVPGKSMVGIEVPNSVAGVVSLRSIIESAAFHKLRAKTKLPLALGKGVSGESVVADLAKMPHLLIAGATGSGKSVCLKSMIATFLFHATPDEVRFLLIDAKRVELVDFNNVPHLVSPVIVDRERAVATLKWLNKEMDHRYDKLASVGARDIEGYNKNPRVSEPLPYLLLIIDELADLMAAAPDEVERTICRLAQLARATGIHIIVATQRPSVDVVTGLIKANFPARISFAVASQVDSRTILDSGGAEKLLGRGDMLFLPPDAAKPKRLQGSFASEAEIERLVSFWISQRPREVYVPQLVEELAQASLGASAGDPLLEMAKRLAQEHRRISTSFLQRRLGIGYPRAARLMDLLEEQGVVAIGEPGKSREVLHE
ncbi:MAG: DNA translocase FtsK [Dehalococcoidia bacterium]|nr:DNA translocase FtsK [Dehalococcoidia bacterium]